MLILCVIFLLSICAFVRSSDRHCVTPFVSIKNCQYRLRCSVTFFFVTIFGMKERGRDISVPASVRPFMPSAPLHSYLCSRWDVSIMAVFCCRCGILWQICRSVLSEGPFVTTSPPRRYFVFFFSLSRCFRSVCRSAMKVSRRPPHPRVHRCVAAWSGTAGLCNAHARSVRQWSFSCRCLSGGGGLLHTEVVYLRQEIEVSSRRYRRRIFIGGCCVRVHSVDCSERRREQTGEVVWKTGSSGNSGISCYSSLITTSTLD